MSQSVSKTAVRSLLDGIDRLYEKGQPVGLLEILEELIKFGAEDGSPLLNERIEMLLTQAEAIGTSDATLEKEHCMQLIHGILSPEPPAPAVHNLNDHHHQDADPQQSFLDQHNLDPLIVQLLTPQKAAETPFRPLANARGSLMRPAGTLASELKPALPQAPLAKSPVSSLPKSTRMRAPSRATAAATKSAPTGHLLDMSASPFSAPNAPQAQQQQQQTNVSGDLLSFGSPSPSRVIAANSDNHNDAANALDMYFMASTPPPAHNLSIGTNGSPLPAAQQLQQPPSPTAGTKRSVTPSRIPLNRSRSSPGRPATAAARNSEHSPGAEHAIDAPMRSHSARPSESQQEEASQLQRNIREVYRKMEEMQHVRSSLEKDLDNAQAELKQTQKRYQHKRDEVATLRKTEKEYFARMNEMEQMVKKLEQAVATHQDSIGELKRKLKDAKDNSDQCQAQLELKEEQLLRMKAELDDKAAQLASVLTERDHIAATVEEVHQHLTEADELQEAYNLLKTENEELHATVTQLENEREQQRAKQASQVNLEAPPLMRQMSLGDELAAFHGPAPADDVPAASSANVQPLPKNLNLKEATSALQQMIRVLPGPKKHLGVHLTAVQDWLSGLQETQARAVQVAAPPAQQQAQQPRKPSPVPPTAAPRAEHNTQTELTSEHIDTMLENEDVLRVFQADAQASAVDNVRWQEERLALQSVADDLRQQVAQLQQQEAALRQRLSSQEAAQSATAVPLKSSGSLRAQSMQSLNPSKTSAIASTTGRVFQSHDQLSRKKSVSAVAIPGLPTHMRMSQQQLRHRQAGAQSSEPSIAEAAEPEEEQQPSAPDVEPTQPSLLDLPETLKQHLRRLYALQYSSSILPLALLLVVGLSLATPYFTAHPLLPRPTASTPPPLNTLVPPANSGGKVEYVKPSVPVRSSPSAPVPFHPELDPTWHDVPAWLHSSSSSSSASLPRSDSTPITTTTATSAPSSKAPSSSRPGAASPVANAGVGADADDFFCNSKYAYWRPPQHAQTSPDAGYSWLWSPVQSAAYVLERSLERVVVTVVDFVSGTDSTQWSDSVPVPS
ncbi:hypothetical protein RI367_005772 [Sorochytrium milnesiophthora]